MTIELKPVLPDSQLKDAYVIDGKYNVQIEIPACSTLNEKERLLVDIVCPWIDDPNRYSNRISGGRNFIVDREKPITKRDMELGGLEFGGISRNDFKIVQKSMIYGDRILPPSRQNFMEKIPTEEKNIMKSMYFENFKAIVTGNGYRPTGTYSNDEFMRKLENTMKISEIKFESMITPHIEAYGRFLDPELANENGNFGFFVFPVPDSKVKRIAGETNSGLIKIIRETEDTEMALEKYYDLMEPYVVPLTVAYRELHENELGHFQTHLANSYLTGAIPYIVDWATMKGIGKKWGDEIGNRTLDVHHPLMNYKKFLRLGFPGADARLIEKSIQRMFKTIFRAYIGDPQMEVEYEWGRKKAKEMMGTEPDTFQIMNILIAAHLGEKSEKKETKSEIIIMEDSSQKILSDKQKIHSEANKKVGRNDPCPCGSQLKFKRCCGGH